MLKENYWRAWTRLGRGLILALLMTLLSGCLTTRAFPRMLKDNEDPLPKYKSIDKTTRSGNVFRMSLSLENGEQVYITADLTKTRPRSRVLLSELAAKVEETDPSSEAVKVIEGSTDFWEKAKRRNEKGNIDSQLSLSRFTKDGALRGFFIIDEKERFVAYLPLPRTRLNTFKKVLLYPTAPFYVLGDVALLPYTVAYGLTLGGMAAAGAGPLTPT